MRSLSSTLLAAQKAATNKPYVKVELKQRLGSVTRLKWANLYAGTEDLYYHAAASPGDRSLIRARCSDTSPRKVYRQRVASPTAQSNFTSWTYVADCSYAGVALASAGSKVILFWCDTDTKTIKYIESTDYGASWGSLQTLATRVYGVYHLAAAMKSNGDVMLIFYEFTTANYYKRTGGSWGSVGSMPDTPYIVSGLAVNHQAEWCMAITGRNSSNQRCVWTRTYDDSTWSPLTTLLLADNTALDYRAPSLAYDPESATHRMTFVEQSSSDVTYKRVYQTFHAPEAENVTSPETYDFAADRWKEPFPFYPGHTWTKDLYYGFSICCNDVYSYLTDPRGVWQAELDPTPLSLTPHVITVRHQVSSPVEGRSQALVEVENPAGDLTADMMTDAELAIGAGYVTSSGNETSQGPSAWVTAYELRSSEGKSTIVLVGGGPEVLLELQRFRFQRKWDHDSTSVLDLLKWTFARAGLVLHVDASSTLATSLKPAFTIHPNDTALEVVRKLLRMISDVLYQRGPAVCLTTPPSSTAYEYTLPSVAGKHPLYGGRYRTETDEVNWADVWATTTPWLTYDEFVDRINDQYDRFTHVNDLNADTTTLIKERARALIARPHRFRAEGEAIIPPNVGLDLWDRADIDDDRVNVDRVFRVAGYILSYQPSRKTYRMELQLAPDAVPTFQEWSD
jgi:hypothetical protein